MPMGMDSYSMTGPMYTMNMSNGPVMGGGDGTSAMGVSMSKMGGMGSMPMYPSKSYGMKGMMKGKKMKQFFLTTP